MSIWVLTFKTWPHVKRCSICLGAHANVHTIIHANASHLVYIQGKISSKPKLKHFTSNAWQQLFPKKNKLSTMSVLEIITSKIYMLHTRNEYSVLNQHVHV